MQKIAYRDLVPNTTYYIEIPRRMYYGPIYNIDHMDTETHGLFVKQKAVFIKHNNYAHVFCLSQFKDIVCISRAERGDRYTGFKWLHLHGTTFYLPVAEELVYKVNRADYQLINNVLQKITGDPYFLFYNNI